MGSDMGAPPLPELATLTVTRPLEAGWKPKRANGSIVVMKMPSKNLEDLLECLLGYHACATCQKLYKGLSWESEEEGGKETAGFSLLR